MKAQKLTVGGIVGDLVTREETDNVVVLAKVVDNSLVTLEQINIPYRVVAVDGQGGLAQVSNDIDTSGVEQLHAG